MLNRLPVISAYMIKKVLTGLTVILSLILLLASCDANRVYEKNKEIPAHTWVKQYTVHFKVPVNDTVSPHSVYINIRNYSDYPFSNIYLFIHVVSPAGDSLTDTLNYVLADKRGKWLGRGIGDMYFIRFPYKQNIRFPYPGIYLFDIEQGMRIDLKGIRDVGLRIERLKTNKGGEK